MTLRSRRRWRFGLSIAAGVLLVVAIGSCFQGMFVSRVSGSGWVYSASVTRGALHVVREDRRGLHRLPDPAWRASVERTEGTPRVQWLPSWTESAAPLAGQNWFARVPLWIPFVLLAAPGAWLWWRRLSHPAHICVACGYDLRGLRAGRCPECGRAVCDLRRSSAAGLEGE